MTIPRRLRLAVLLLIMFMAGGLLLAPAVRPTAASEDTEPTVAEVKGVIPAGDGVFIEVSALVDTSVADPDDVIEELAPNRIESAGVVAAFALWRQWSANDIPVEVQYNPDWDPLFLSGRSAMQWSIGQWNSVQGSSFRFVEGPDTDAYASSNLCNLQIADGINTVRFSYLLPLGTLGSTCAVVSGFQSGVPRVTEFDIQLDATADWEDGPQTPEWAYDLRSTMLHELGHALGLDHTDSAGGVMLPSIGLGEQFRTITSDDRAGVLAMYGGASVTPTPTATPATGGPVGEYRAFAPMLARDFVQPPPPTPPPTTPPPPPASFITFGPGTWLVGSEVPAGTYRTRTNREACYWERLSGLTGDLDDIIANEFSDHTQVVTIAPTDLAFSTDSDCGIWTNDLSPITQSPTAPFQDGQYIVGTDIAPGVWRAPGGDGCYWARLEGFSHRIADIAANDFAPINPTVQILPGDKGFETNECGAWSKIG